MNTIIEKSVVFFRVWNKIFCKRMISSSVAQVEKAKPELAPSPDERSQRGKLIQFIENNAPIKALSHKIPTTHLKLKLRTLPSHLHLIDPIVAKSIANHILSAVKDIENEVICETNAGLGLIATELLGNGVKRVRLYEPYAQFRNHLMETGTFPSDRVELYNKDIYQLSRYSYMDKMDKSNRVGQLLDGVPKKNWIDDPAMTIIGPLPRNTFIKHLIYSLALQCGIITRGRIRLFPIIRPRDYAVLTATPEDNLHTYQIVSILFNLLFDIKLIEKYPRNVFLPWESENKIKPHTRYPDTLEPNLMYLVQIDFKKEFPVSTEELMPLVHFVKTSFSRGSRRIIPAIEQWVPGSGADVITSELLDEINIFTKFRELTPVEILRVFQQMLKSESYKTSPFTAMVESQVEKNITVGTSEHEAAMATNVVGSSENIREI